MKIWLIKPVEYTEKTVIGYYWEFSASYFRLGRDLLG